MSQPVILTDLIRDYPGEYEGAAPPVAITGVTQDSRRVTPGSLFVAVAGGSADGHDFIAEAVLRGAAVVVGTRPAVGLPVPYLRTADSRWSLAALSAAFYGYPARQLTVLGVTGTDGKTTTANYIYRILEAAGIRAGLISTVNAQIGKVTLDTGFHVTTPEAPEIQSILAQMLAAGLTHVVLEATSHGLDQGRVVACEFDLGVVTNITHEHLDYHGSYAAYLAAKASLLTGLAQTAVKDRGNYRVAVLNQEEPSYQPLCKLLEPYGEEIRQVAFGFSAEAQVSARDIEILPDGIRFTASAAGRSFPVESQLAGKYNVLNCLAAIAATVDGLGLDIEVAQLGIAALDQIPGRMESIDLGQDFLAIVDFAHTPNALKRALESAREMIPGRVIAVFGSAGLRDRAKRRMMAETSARLADLTILTAEDPRTEPLEDILDEMATGAQAQGTVEGRTYWRIPDRGEAIRFAVSLAQPGDVVLACGKGHEQSMCFGDIEYPWDDRTAMRAAVADRLGIAGPQAPSLPTSRNARGFSC